MTAIATDCPRLYSSGDSIDQAQAQSPAMLRLPNSSPLSCNDIEYEEIEDTDNPQHTEEDDIAEYWDPYRELSTIACTVHAMHVMTLSQNCNLCI